MAKQEYWKGIWESKGAEIIVSQDILGSLIKADGFDTGSGDYSADQWKSMTIAYCQILGVTAESKVLEVGCGAGAFLYGIRAHTQAKVFGYDYSSSLIEICKRYVEGEFKVSEARVNPFDSIKFDFAISHSVFHYFANEQYAFDTIKTMANSLASGGSIALLDVNDSNCEETYHITRKLNYRNPAEYDEKYLHLPHLFLSRQRIAMTLKVLGFGDIRFVNYPIAEYKNAQYRFNVIARKQ